MNELLKQSLLVQQCAGLMLMKLFFTISLYLGFVELASLSNIAWLPVNCIYILVLVY